jgi:hypothetical protein
VIEGVYAMQDRSGEQTSLSNGEQRFADETRGGGNQRDVNLHPHEKVLLMTEVMWLRPFASVPEKDALTSQHTLYELFPAGSDRHTNTTPDAVALDEA